jgi:proteasome lid subunit RPN8/RPN11
MEVGGILVGSRINHTVQVMDARPLLISHGRGAAFLLTDGDYEALDGLIQRANAEFAPKGLEVIGYYESHARREPVLSEADIETYNTRFDQPTRVCIVLKPNNENGTIVNVYIRDPRGEIVQTELEGDSVRYEEAPIPEPAIAPVSPISSTSACRRAPAGRSPPAASSRCCSAVSC